MIGDGGLVNFGDVSVRLGLIDGMRPHAVTWRNPGRTQIVVADYRYRKPLFTSMPYAQAMALFERERTRASAEYAALFTPAQPKAES